MSAERGTEGSSGPVSGDLDALAVQSPDTPTPQEGSRRPTRRRRTGLVVEILLAASLGAGVGALVTSRHEQALARDAEAVLGLQAGFPSLVSGTDPGTGDAQGRAPITVSLPLSNRGNEAVTVSVLGLDAHGQRTDGRPPRVMVPVGATVPVLLRLVVECAEHPPVSSAAARADRTVVRVRIPSPTGERTADLPLAQPPGAPFEGLLSFACRPASQRVAPVDAQWFPQQDGTMRVVVSNFYSTAPVMVDLRQTPGMGVTSDQPLPLTIASGDAGEARLSMEPRCSAVRRVDQPPSGDVTLVTVVDGVVQATIADGDGDGRVRWLTRRLALACG